MDSKFKMEKALAQRLEAFQQQASVAGEHVVFRVFPAKILELQDVLQSTSLPTSPYHPDLTSTTTDTTVYPAPASQANGEQPQSKKRKMDDDSVASGAVTNDTQYARLPNVVHANKHLVDLHATLKRECEELVTLTDQVKLWISLTMPKIEGCATLFAPRSGIYRSMENFVDRFWHQLGLDQNSLDLAETILASKFKRVVAELLRSQESAFNLRDSARNNYLARAKICSKLIKYPNIEDYTLALKEHDDNQFYLVRQHIIDLRNIYAVLTDLIHKNIAKIRAPRGNNSVALY